MSTKHTADSVCRGKGRPRAFDRAQALHSALKIFWKQGYEPASVAELCKAMEINPPSLYATFGNKASLFLEALRHYEHTYWDAPAKHFLAEPDVYTAVANFFRESAQILLSPEMEPMERKLNVLRQTLEKRELEAKLAEERKNNLVMYLAHDIRTPLTSVIGYLSLLEEAPDMPPEQKAKYVHITLEKANRLEGLIQEFFEITRYNIQQIRLDKEWIDLYYMLVQMIEEFYPLMAEKGNRAALHSTENIKIFGDPTKLARVFNNILKNAIAYSAPNTPISICVEELPTAGLDEEETATGDRKIRISFRNQGMTIPQDKLTAIFDKFYRMDEARNSNTGGAGLGLAIAREIVTLHEGKIYAASEKGEVVFCVELPHAAE